MEGKLQSISPWNKGRDETAAESKDYRCCRNASFYPTILPLAFPFYPRTESLFYLNARRGSDKR